MELSPTRSIPSSPIQYLPNERKRLVSKISDINKDIVYFKKRTKDGNPELIDFYSHMLKFSENEKNRNIDLLNKINTEISNIDKISPPNKKRNRSNGGTKKKSRRNRRNSSRSSQ